MLYQTYIAGGANEGVNRLYRTGYYSSPLYQATGNYNTRLYNVTAQPWFIGRYQ